MHGVVQQIHAVVDNGCCSHDLNNKQGNSIGHVSPTQLADGLGDAHIEIETEGHHPGDEDKPAIPMNGHLHLSWHIRFLRVAGHWTSRQLESASERAGHVAQHPLVCLFLDESTGLHL